MKSNEKQNNGRIKCFTVIEMCFCFFYILFRAHFTVEIRLLQNICVLFRCKRKKNIENKRIIKLIFVLQLNVKCLNVETVIEK